MTIVPTEDHSPMSAVRSRQKQDQKFFEKKDQVENKPRNLLSFKRKP